MANSKEVYIVETTKGQITADKLSSFGICLFHQRLVPIVHPISSDRPLNIQHIEYHRNHLLSLQNTSLTAAALDHQIQQLLQSSNRTPSEVIILDGSNYESRVPEILQRYAIVKGYQYKLSGNPSQSQKAVLLSKDHISKQIQYQFKLGNGKFKPGFIGELEINECIEKADYFNAFKAYLEFSAKNNCLIIINSLQVGTKPVCKYLKGQNSELQRKSINSELQIFKKIQQVLHHSKMAKAKKVVLYNIPFIFETIIDKINFTQTTENIFHSYILQLFQKFDCYFGFDLSKYSQNVEAQYYIAQLAANFPKRVILSSGLTYKIDLTAYGGQGYLLYNGKLNSIAQIANSKNIKDALFNTKLELLSWKIKLQQIKIVVKWKCSQCSLQQSEQIQSFRKFGKQFCSIKCLKGHKF